MCRSVALCFPKAVNHGWKSHVRSAHSPVKRQEPGELASSDGSAVKAGSLNGAGKYKVSRLCSVFIHSQRVQSVGPNGSEVGPVDLSFSDLYRLTVEISMELSLEPFDRFSTHKFPFFKYKRRDFSALGRGRGLTWNITEYHPKCDLVHLCKSE